MLLNLVKRGSTAFLNVFKKRAKREGSKRKRVRLCVEALESRLVPSGTPNIWNNSSTDRKWETGANWSLTHVPASDETPTFNNTSTAGVTVNNSTIVYGLDIQANYGGTITLSSSRLEVTNLVNQYSGTISGGTMVFDGQGGGVYTWQAGTRSGTDPVRMTTTIASGAALKLQGSADKIVDGATITDGGTTTWTDVSTIALKNHATWDNTGGTFTEKMSAPLDRITGDSGTAFKVDLGATFTVQPLGTGDLSIDAPFTMQGTLNVQDNAVSVTAAGATFSGTTNINVNTATLNIDNDATLNVATFQGVGKVVLLGGTITVSGTNSAKNVTLQTDLGGSGTLNLTGSASWVDGDWNGTGTINVSTGGTLEIRRDVIGATLNMKGGWKLTNSGTTELGAVQVLQVDGGTNITNSGTFNLLGGNINFSGVGTVGTFTNNLMAGLYAQGGATTKSGLKFTNMGTLELDAGTLEFLTDITQSAGKTYLNGGNLKIDGTVGFTITGGIIQGSGTITAVLVDNGGSIDQSALGTFQTLNIAGAYKQEAGGALRERITKTNNVLQFDRLVVTGQATLGGTLTVTATGGYMAVAGDSADILDYASRVGDFDPLKITLPFGMTTNPQAAQYFIKK